VSRKLRIVTHGEVKANPPPAVHKLWGALGEHDLAILHSSEKMGKTMLGLNLAIAGARGDAEYLGLPLRPGGFTTLLLNGEVHLRGIYERITTMEATGELTPEQAQRIRYNAERGLNVSDPQVWAEFRRLLGELKPDLVILDPLAHVLDVDENSNTEVGKALTKLLALRNDPGCAVLLIHHDGKASETNSGRAPHQRMRGANRIAADADAIFSLVPLSQKRGPVGRLHTKDRNARSPEPFRVRLNDETLWFECYSEDQEYGEALQNWLAAAGGSMTVKELETKAADAWNLKDVQGRTVKRRIKKALGAGFLAESINDQQEPIYITNKTTEDDE
jgi:hypothetical protein